MQPPAGYSAGFCFSAEAADGTTRFIVNVCGHPSIEPPLSRSMDAVPESFLDTHGLDNLIVPISVSPPRKCHGVKADYVVDVVVHPSVTARCLPSHRLSQHFLDKLTPLSLEWILQETGARLNGRTCKLLGVAQYVRGGDEKKGGQSAAPDVEEIIRMAAEMANKAAVAAAEAGGATASAAADATDNDAASSLPPELRVTKEDAPAKKKKMVQEVIANPGIKKGFLNDNKKPLYGPNGTSEGSKPLYDPLSVIPESLRQKCRIIDTREPAVKKSSGDDLLPTPPSPAQAPAPPAPSALAPSTASSAPPPSSKWTFVSAETAKGEIMVSFQTTAEKCKVSDVDLFVDGDFLEVDGYRVKMPSAFDEESLRAKFVKSTKTLQVTCKATS